MGKLDCNFNSGGKNPSPSGGGAKKQKAAGSAARGFLCGTPKRTGKTN
jgi:hypothetical protein